MFCLAGLAPRLVLQGVATRSAKVSRTSVKGNHFADAFLLLYVWCPEAFRTSKYAHNSCSAILLTPDPNLLFISLMTFRPFHHHKNRVSVYNDDLIYVRSNAYRTHRSAFVAFYWRAGRVGRSWIWPANQAILV